MDLNKEQEAGFAQRVASMAQEAGFEPRHEAKKDDAFATFTLQKE